ncbi:hypothetical protein [Nocardia sp. bgisy134]|uniref:hypothetical protein n=1 Tax=Nocardia sp. bgisy134 TaxID=3413789 RepID=UPI003D75D252
MTNPGTSFVTDILGNPVAALQQKATTSQQNALKQDQEIGVGQVDAPYVTNQENPPETMTHQEIWDAVNSIDKEAMWKLVTAWSNASTTATMLFQMHRMALTRAMQDKWESAGADAARQASERFAKAGEQAGEIAQSVGLRLDSMYNAAVALAAAVPPVPTSAAPNPDNPNESVLPGLTGGEKDRSDTEAATNARNEAISAVNRIYLPIFPPAGENVPTLIAPPSIGNDDPGTPNSGVPNNQPSANTPNPNNGNPTAPSREQPVQNPSEPGSTKPANATDQASTNPAGTTQPQSTSPASVNQGNPSSPTSNQPGALSNPGTTPGTPNQSPIGSTPGRPGSSTTAPAPRPGMPGTSVPGNPNSSTPGSGAAGNSAASRAASGRPGTMGPMAPGAAARRKDDDAQTRGVPDYLKGVQSELADLPPAPSGAIGSDYDAWTSPGGAATPSASVTTSAAPYHPASASAAPTTPSAASEGESPSAQRRAPALPVRYSDGDELPAAPLSTPASSATAPVAPRAAAPPPPPSMAAPLPTPLAATAPIAEDAGAGAGTDGQPSDGVEATPEPEDFSFSGEGPIMDDDEPTDLPGAGR